MPRNCGGVVSFASPPPRARLLTISCANGGDCRNIHEEQKQQQQQQAPTTTKKQPETASEQGTEPLSSLILHASPGNRAFPRSDTALPARLLPETLRFGNSKTKYPPLDLHVDG
ncbi:unnamed protein product [Calypogeia fissa]